MAADCPPDPITGLYGVAVDVYEVGSDDPPTMVETDANGGYVVDGLLPGEYEVTMVTPLGYTVASEDAFATVAGDVATANFDLNCEEIIPSQRSKGFWKHQVGVAVGGKGTAQIDGAMLCTYLDRIEDHFNANSINEVVVYVPPAEGTCEPDSDLEPCCTEKLEVARELLNLKGKAGMTPRAKQHLMALLLNVASSKLSLTEIISEDGATVSQAITYCDNLIDDPGGDHEIAKDIAETINRGDLVSAGVIPLSTANIAYRRPAVILEQNHPNPFASHTTFRFALSSPGEYTLSIYNITGQLVRRYAGTAQGKDVSLSWDARDSMGRVAAPGVYFYRVQAGGLEQTRRMVLIR